MTSFNCYAKIDNNRYRENYGLTFEAFTIGQKFVHRPGVTVSQDDNKQEAIDTINNAQLHYDEHYASQTEWKKCLFDSTLTLQIIMGMPWKTFARKHSLLQFNTIAMVHPVFGGDTLYAESEILNKQETQDSNDTGLITVATSGLNQKGEIVCKIEYQLLVYKKGKHPAEKNLPAAAFELSEERFSAYRTLEDGRLMEQVGLFYEDLNMAEIYEHFPAKTISPEECRVHAYRALNWHPRYADAQYINLYQDGKFYVNESLLVGVMTALTTRTFGRVVANLEWKNIQFKEKVLAGDTIRVESSIISKRESKSRPAQGIIQVNSYAYNQHNVLVCSYERHLLVYKKGLGPYQAAGY